MLCKIHSVCFNEYLTGLNGSLLYLHTLTVLKDLSWYVLNEPCSCAAWMEALLLRTEWLVLLKLNTAFAWMARWPSHFGVLPYVRLHFVSGAALSRCNARVLLCNFDSNHKWKVLILGKQRQSGRHPIEEKQKWNTRIDWFHWPGRLSYLAGNISHGEGSKIRLVKGGAIHAIMKYKITGFSECHQALLDAKRMSNILLLQEQNAVKCGKDFQEIRYGALGANPCVGQHQSGLCKCNTMHRE